MKTARLWAGVAIAAALLLSCGGHHREPPVALPHIASPAATPAATTLDEALAELDALPTPDGVDAALFADLKAALAEALRDAAGASRLGVTVPLHENDTAGDKPPRVDGDVDEGRRATGARPASAGKPTGKKLVAAPPMGESNRVTDLSATGATATTVNLSWHYVNVGDYNQDGLVSIQDITPLAVHFGESWHEVGGWPSPVDEVIDGNGDRAITIADITPLAAYFFTSCEGYEVQGKAEAVDEFARISEVRLSEAQGGGRLSFSATVERAGCVFFRVVPADAYGELGEPSNIAQIDTRPPTISDVTPMGGITGSEVQFTCSVSGAQPMSYAWDFGGGAEPGSSATRSPTVTLGDVGEYATSLTATNAFGEDTHDFTLSVTPAPPVIESVSPNEGPSGSDVAFTATLTGTPPFVFNWDFATAADPSTPQTSEPQVTVTLLSEGFYEASVTAENAAGEDTFTFPLTVTEPMEPPTISEVEPGSGIEGAEVTFTATVTGDEPIDYYWDFDHGAEPNTPETSEPSVTVDLLAEGSYEASLTAQNAAGSDAFPFTLQVLPTGTGFKVTAATVAAEHPSLIVVDGKPAIAFSEDGGALCYVHAKDALGSQWQDHVQISGIGAFYRNNLMRIIAGRPAVASSVGFWMEGGLITFSRAQDVAGDEWNSPLTVFDDFEIGPTAPGLLEVMGRPAIAFSSDDYSEDCKLFYFRAENAEGTEWPETPVKVASMSGPSHAQSSLVFADGNPAILHTWWEGAIYVRAKDMYGNEWGKPVELGKMTESSCMTLIGHNPAVAIVTGGELPHAVIYRRAKDPAGSAWDDPVTVDEEVWIVQNGRVCLAEISGRPAITYRDSTLHISCPAKYAIAKDAEGREWYDPIEAEPDTKAGISLAEVAGRPAIACRPWIGEELIYIWANDQYGLDWPDS